MFITSSCGTCSNRQASRAIAKAEVVPNFFGSASAFLIPRKSKSWDYFAAGVALDLDLDLVFGAGEAGVCSVALRARLRSRFFALDRLRVFSRAFSFGMVGAP